MDELLKAYPGCPNAIDWCEGEIMEKFIWEFERMQGTDPLTVAHKLKNVGLISVKDVSHPVLVAALPEMDHPDFLKYVAAKLGAM